MNPNKNRLIMFIILFSGFGLMGFGSCCASALDKWVCYVISFIMIIFSFIWGIKKIRCPYCHNLLSMKIYYNRICPYCGERIDNIK